MRLSCALNHLLTYRIPCVRSFVKQRRDFTFLRPSYIPTLVFLFRAADQTNWSDIDLLKRAVTSLSVWPSAAYYYRAKTLRVTSLIEIFEQIVFDSKTFVIIYRMHLSKMNSAENLAGLMQCRINPFRGSYANTKWGPF